MPIKRLLILAIAILLCSVSARATTFTAATCASTAFQAQINLATDNDTVNGPSGGGSATWTAIVTVSKGITLNGNGCSVTFGSGGGMTVTPDTVANAFITGFTFLNAGLGNGQFTFGFRTSCTANNKPFRFHHNTLSGAGTFVEVTGFGPGLFDHNSLTFNAGADEVFHILGSGAGGNCPDQSGWTSIDVVPGGPNMIFVEDNTLVEQSSVEGECLLGHYGAQVVWRHNTQTNCGTDFHGYNGADPSGRWFEIYQNTFITPSGGMDGSTHIRGGSGVYWGNTTTGGPASNAFGEYCGSSDACSGPWPMYTQLGRGMGGNTSSPIYAWGLSGMSVDCGVTPCLNNAQVNPGSSTYVQLGTAPTDAAHCSGHAGNVCDVVSTVSQPATLLRCQSAADMQAGCPVSYNYVPYPYPHPLQQGTSGGPPPAPTITSIVVQ